jgi:hypothetical protein
MKTEYQTPGQALLGRLRHHVTGAIERGEGVAIIGVPVRTPIGMSEFFALERVKDLQRMQSRNPYGSKNHRWASEQMRALADQYCDDKGESCVSHFGDY